MGAKKGQENENLHHLHFATFGCMDSLESAVMQINAPKIKRGSSQDAINT